MNKYSVFKMSLVAAILAAAARTRKFFVGNPDYYGTSSGRSYKSIHHQSQKKQRLNSRSRR